MLTFRSQRRKDEASIYQEGDDKPRPPSLQRANQENEGKREKNGVKKVSKRIKSPQMAARKTEALECLTKTRPCFPHAFAIVTSYGIITTLEKHRYCAQSTIL